MITVITETIAVTPEITQTIDKIKQTGQAMLNSLELPDWDLGVMLTDNKTIQEYNKNYRNKDKPTDILSFAFHPDHQPGETLVALEPDEKNLGDLIISLEYAQADAPKWEHTWDEHLVMLLSHGICHLLGYRHETDEQHTVMRKIEEKLRNLFRKSGFN